MLSVVVVLEWFDALEVLPIQVNWAQRNDLHAECLLPSTCCCLLLAACHLPLAGRQAERAPKHKWNEASLACVPLLFGSLKEIASIWCRPLMNTLPMCKLQLRLNTYAGCPAVCPDSGNFRNIGTSQCQQGEKMNELSAHSEYSNIRTICNFSIWTHRLWSVGSQ